MTIETTCGPAREELQTLMDRALDGRESIMRKSRTGG